MDLPTCPACKQSVLDEDAVDCPFCGASMKAGPSAGRTASPPATRATVKRSAPPAKLPPGAAAAADEKGEPAAAKAAPSPPKRSAPGDDDPFAVDDAAVSKAIPASPKPAAGKSLEVKCPMCETTGYVSPKAAGQQVRCCNPECLVPIFSAPAPKKAPPPPPPPPPKKPIGLYVAIGVVALCALGGGYWFLNGAKAPDELPPLPVSTNTSASSGTTESGDTIPKAADRKATEKAPTVTPEAALNSQILKKLNELNPNVPTNRKAYARRLTATALIESGDLPGGREQIDQLLKIGKQTPFEACLPTVLLAWRQVDAPDAFAKEVAEAKRRAETLPPRGRYAIEAGIGTAAALVAAGQMDEARKMIAAHQGPPDLKQLAAVCQVVQNNQTYDFDSALIGRSLGDWIAPLETGVTLILAAHGRWDDAQVWSEQSTDPLVRAETALVWAEAFARQSIASDPAADMTRAVAISDSLPPPAQARVLARLAAVQFEAGNRETASQFLNRASTLLAGIPEPAPFRLQGARSILDLKLPDGTTSRLAALGGAEIGLVQSQLGEVNSAWGSFQLAFRHLRGTAPGLSFAQQRLSQIEGSGAEKIRGELKSALQLKTDDQVRLNFSQYKQKVTEMNRAAFRRFLWQTELLEVAARAGLLDQVADEIDKGEARPDLSERDPLLTSSVPFLLVELLKEAGKAERQETLAEATKGREKSMAPEFVARIIAEGSRRAIDAGKVTETLKNINQSLTDTGTLHEASLRLACRLVKSGKTDEAIQFVRGLRDTLLREDGLYLVAALASRLGHSADVWKRASAGLSQTETAAVCAGIVTGLAHAAPAK